MSDYWSSRLTGKERQAIMNLDMMTRTFEAAVDILKERRLNDYRYLKRDVKLVESIAIRLIKLAIDGMPDDIAAVLSKQSRDFRLVPERISPIKPKLECVMPLEDEWQFVQIAVDSRCSICLKTPAECDACPLRKLLRRYANEPDTEARGCGFQGCGLNDSTLINKPKRL